MQRAKERWYEVKVPVLCAAGKQSARCPWTSKFAVGSTHVQTGNGSPEAPPPEQNEHDQLLDLGPAIATRGALLENRCVLRRR